MVGIIRRMIRDHLDEVLKQWKRTRPDLDPAPMGVVGRILRLAGQLEQRANAALAPFDLAIWGFDVLATLRRQGEPYSLTPTQLMSATVLSSGAMTNRIDRLERLGLVTRSRSQDDRRSFLVTLTPQGIKVVDAALAARLAEAKEATDGLTTSETASLAALLRKMLVGLESPPVQAQS